MTQIVLIGCGNIGKRHLQAVSGLDIPLLCHDKNTEALDSIPSFLEQNNLSPAFKTQKSLKKTIADIDDTTIVIIATTADGRKKLIEKILLKKPRAIIAEKPIVQNLQELIGLAQTETDIPIYVNLSRHSYPDYQEIKKELRGQEQIRIVCQAGNLGFATNGIHFIDLAVWLSCEKTATITYSEAGNTFETKRQGFFDFPGTMELSMGPLKTARISLLSEDTVASITITTKEREWKILENKNKMIIIDNEVRLVPFTNVYTSQITGKVVQDIISGNTPELPTLQECAHAHELLFAMMKKHKLKLNIT